MKQFSKLLCWFVLCLSSVSVAIAGDFDSIDQKYDGSEQSVYVSEVKGKLYYSGKILGCVTEIDKTAAPKCHPADEIEFWVSCSKDNGASGDTGTVEVYMKGWTNTFTFDGRTNDGFMSDVSQSISTDFCDLTVEGDNECDDCEADNNGNPSGNSAPSQGLESNGQKEQPTSNESLRSKQPEFPPNAIIGFMTAARAECQGFNPDGSRLWKFVESQLARPDLNKAEVDYFAKEFRNRVSARGTEQACKDAAETVETIRGADFDALAKANASAGTPRLDKEEYLAIGGFLRAEKICPNVQFRDTKAWERYVARGMDLNADGDQIQLGGQIFDGWVNERGLGYACSRAAEIILMGSM